MKIGDSFKKIVIILGTPKPFYSEEGVLEMNVYDFLMDLGRWRCELVRKAEPQKYRLLQAEDFICSTELLKIKRDEKRLSKSEEHFFCRLQESKKTFLKSVEEKKL